MSGATEAGELAALLDDKALIRSGSMSDDDELEFLRHRVCELERTLDEIAQSGYEELRAEQERREALMRAIAAGDVVPLPRLRRVA